jgi:hypothetical protein
VIGGLLGLVLEVMLSGGNELLVGVIGLLVVAALIIASSDRDLLGSPLWTPPVTFSVCLCTPAGCLDVRPLIAIGVCLLVALDKNGSDRLLSRGVPRGDVQQLLHGLD